MAKYKVGDVVTFQAMPWLHPASKEMTAPIIEVMPREHEVTLYTVAVDTWYNGERVTEALLMEQEITGKR